MPKHYFVIQKIIKVNPHHIIIIIITEGDKLANIILLNCS